MKLEGSFSYLVAAAPIVAACSAIISPLAEATWRAGDHVKAAFWWLALLPAVAVVFFATAERVHVAKSGAEAERGAIRSAAERADASLKTAKLDAAKAQAEADKTRGVKTCGPLCRMARETAEARQADALKAEAVLVQADTAAKQESPLKAPVWLLPVALDLVAYMAIWTGLAGPWRQVVSQPRIKTRVKRVARKSSPVLVKKPEASKPLASANDNVVALRH
jgi:hypothetical protein